MNTETATRVCHYCEQTKVWVWNRKKLRDGSKVYVDDGGSRWAGRRCPDCEKIRVQSAVKYDTFKRDNIIRELEKDGYQILSRCLPLRVEKDGVAYTVSVNYAQTKDGKVVLETPLSETADIHALIFETVRLFRSDQVEKIRPHLSLYREATLSS